MKAIKILLVFVLILGGVLGAFYLINNDSVVELSSMDDNGLETYRKLFQQDWENVGDWSEEIFSKHCDLVNQLSKDYETTSLRDMNTSTAVEVVYIKIFERWKASNCKKKDIDKYINAISIIEKADYNATSNPNVTIIRDVYKTYKQAYNLAYRKIGLSVEFDGSTWNSYSNYASSINKELESIKKKTNYTTYLSNISEIKSNLESIPSRLSSGRARFYDSLADKIIASFSEITSTDRTRDDLNKLRNIISKYQEEHRANSKLDDFAKTFANNVYANEERIKKEELERERINNYGY